MHVHFQQVEQWKCGGQEQAEREKYIIYTDRKKKVKDIKSIINNLLQGCQIYYLRKVFFFHHNTFVSIYYNCVQSEF